MEQKYEVVFKKSSLKELKLLPKKTQKKILDAVQLLSINPFTEILPIKKLKGTDNLFRIRVQNYRIIYTIENHILKITIIRIGHRKDVYA